MNIVIGYRKGTAKESKKPYCIIYYTSDYSLESAKYGCVGAYGCEVFVPSTYNIEDITPDILGKEVEVVYQSVNNKPRVCDLIFK